MKVLKFIAPFLILLVTGEILRTSINLKLKQIPAYSDIGKINESLITHPDIAIFGSSTAYMNIDPEIISENVGKSVYNFGISGAAFDQIWHLHQYVKDNPTSQIIVVINPYELEDYDYKLREEELFLHLIDQDKIYAQFQQRSKTDAFFARHLGWSNIFNLNAKHFNLLWNSAIDSTSFKNGFITRDKHFSNYNNFYPTSTFNPLENRLIEFDKFLAQLNKHKNIIFVLTPIVPEVDFSYLKSRFNQYTWLDYSNTEELGDTSYFQDYIHLNKTGAEKFSKILATALRE